MSTSLLMVTGASGHLGRLVIDHLKTLVPAAQIVALVRKPETKAAYEAEGIAARIGDYDDVDSLKAAFDGIDRLLLISSSAVGQRARQHGNAIEAAKAADVGFIAYTSILEAATSPMALAEEHKATEAMLADSGIPHALLRNGWYTENLLASLPTDLELGQHFGCAGEGRFATAPRKDYAEAAAIVLAGGDHAGKAYELAGDSDFTLADFAAELSKQAGKPISYTDMPEDAYTAALVQAGLPEGFAAILADSDAKAAQGALSSTSKDLSTLIGHPTTPLAETIATALAA
ncbi:SDR family oxidoreductase [Pseudodonghicola xiamenensis]|uniref:NAD(P)-dependent oxidoreductase n=1 Tax=Pseudodonghicola xiamenensis TaxID=337702 RepID=A0A8J3H839_9RHOB|nr:SDR family oxidoreductase [Pseudodonghicola xiamenensis]GHG90409.1 NAD(P)-dependent oxidoreductase [Pseudodonghicola xiamenensis]